MPEGVSADKPEKEIRKNSYCRKSPFCAAFAGGAASRCCERCMNHRIHMSKWNPLLLNAQPARSEEKAVGALLFGVEGNVPSRDQRSLSVCLATPLDGGESAARWS